MKSRRLITIGLGAVIALAVSPGLAAAAPSPLVDDSLANFSDAGASAVNTWAIEPGVVQRKPTALSENFDGATLPSGLTSTAWAADGAATLADGVLSVDGTLVNGDALVAPQVLEFRATFGGDDNQHAGFANDFNEPRWAAFSTGSDGIASTLFAIAATPGDPTPTAPVELTGVVATVPHTYRIEWSAGDAKYFVDGELKQTIIKAIAGPMRPVASDLVVHGTAIKVDWLGLGAVPATGTFTSRVLDAGDARAIWGTLTTTPSGAGAAIQTRTGNTATPDSSWSAFQSLGLGGAVQSPAGQYIQYRATLDDATPTLDKVSIDYVVDQVGPTTAIDSAEVSGTTATVRFSSSDADLAGFECSLDGGAFAACTSPKQFTGLAASSHTVAVRAIDKLDNRGTPASRTFSVASPAPPASGGGAQPAPAPTAAADTTAPKVTLKLASARVSKSGVVSLNVGCPASELRCQVAVALKLGRTTIARKTTNVSGGQKVKLTLKLSKSARRQLAKRGKLKVSAVVTATDAAGNKSTSTVKMTLKAPSR